MKVFLALLGLVVVVSHAVHADEELANKLKPFETFSPYKWTQWVALRPSHRPTPVAAAAVAYAPQPEVSFQQYQNPNDPEDSVEDDASDDDDDDDDDSLNGGVSAFANWFKRAILPEPPKAPEVKKAKVKKVKAPTAPTTKKPSIVEVPLDFWAPPPSVAPNVTLPLPPGYYAAKKSMFISKLFAALAASVLNDTEATTPAPVDEPTTAAPTTAAPITTISPRQAILDQISEVLLSDVARSLPSSEETTQEPEEFDDSDEDSDEDEPTTVSKKNKPTPVNPFLLSQIDFLAKLTEALAATQQKATEAPVTTTTTTPKPKPTKPSPTTKKPTKKAAAKKSAKKLAKTPKYLKFLPTSTTPTPTSAQPETAAPAQAEIDYDALARALLGNTKI